MKINEGFALKIIRGVPYILPYGQNIADHKRGVKLNETSLYLWNALQESDSEADLLVKFADYCEADEEEMDIVAKDLNDFLSVLAGYNIIERDTKKNAEAKDIQYLQIGDMIIKLSAPESVIPDKFVDFRVETVDEPDLSIEIENGWPSVCENGQLILRNEELFICDSEDKYILLFPMADQIREGYLTKDGTYARLYVRQPFNDAFREDLFHAIRLLFLYQAQMRGMFAIHSASIIYRDKIWIFAGHSGMGKSTHTNLWNEIYGTPLVNGDLNLLAIRNGKPVVYGMPWCGTSEIYDTNKYELGGIVLVTKARENECEELTDDEKALLVMQRMISPSWLEEQLTANIDFADNIAKMVPVCRLKCTKSPKAVEVMKKWIDLK